MYKELKERESHIEVNEFEDDDIKGLKYEIHNDEVIFDDQGIKKVYGYIRSN